jgi:hypothetical protein
MLERWTKKTKSFQVVLRYLLHMERKMKILQKIQEAVFNLDCDVALTIFYVKSELLEGLTKYNWEKRFDDDLMIARYFADHIAEE